MRRTVIRCRGWSDSSSAAPISIHSSPVAMASPLAPLASRLVGEPTPGRSVQGTLPLNASSTLPLYGAVRGVAVMLLDGLLNLLRRHAPPPGPLASSPA